MFGATLHGAGARAPARRRLITTECRAEVEAYREKVAATDLKERQKTDSAARRACSRARTRPNPATGEEMPIWIADYVLMGTVPVPSWRCPPTTSATSSSRREIGLAIPVVVAPREGPRSADDRRTSDLGRARRRMADTGDVRLVNSGEFSGLRPGRGRPGASSSGWAAPGRAEPRDQYRLHDWCISRQRYWGPPIPIIYCDACGTVPVPGGGPAGRAPVRGELPPGDEAWRRSPLARVESFYGSTARSAAGEARRETDVSDTFLDIDWYFLRYPSTDFSDHPFTRRARSAGSRWTCTSAGRSTPSSTSCTRAS